MKDSKLEGEKMIIIVRAGTKDVRCRDYNRLITTVHQYQKPRKINQYHQHIADGIHCFQLNIVRIT